MLWIAVALTAVLLDQLGGSPSPMLRAATWLGALAIAFGARVFVAHGGPRITTLGIINAACALFVGFGSIQEVISPQHRTPDEYLTTAVLSAVLVQIVASCIAWSRFEPVAVLQALPSDSDARWVARAGGAVLVVLLAGRLLAVPLLQSPLVEAAAFTSVTLIAVGAFFRADARPVSPATGFVVGAFVAYVVFFHGGTGRLRLVGLACVIGLLFSARFPRRRYKVVGLALTPLMILFLAEQRLSLQESLREGASTGRTGLESMTDPIVVFAQIVYAQSEQSLPLAMGRTLGTLPLGLVPESIAPWWRPIPLGYDLVRLTAPDRAGSGYSVAATVYGEWWYNWSVFGMVLLVPVFAASVILADRRLDRAVQVAGKGRRRLLQLALWAMVCGSSADLAWAGLHTYGARLMSRLPILLILTALVYWQPKKIDPILPRSCQRPRRAGVERSERTSTGRAESRDVDQEPSHA